MQIWCAITLVTEIRHRVVMARLLHLTGTVASAREVAIGCNAAALAPMQLKRTQLALVEQANERLEQMDT
jgi:hypothetical protein